MAANKIDMSLDDIIKLNKPQMNARRRNFNPPRRFNSQPRYNNNFNNQRRNPNFGVSRGGVIKATQRYDRSFNDADLTWKHDKFEAFEGAMNPHQPPPASRSSSSTIIRISNLNYTVSDQDVKDLFGEFGSMIRSSLNYDRSGRSLGSAEVEYSNRTSALKAVEQYNKVPLDGLPMEIVLVSNNSNNTQSMGSRLGAKTGYEPYRRGNYASSGYSSRGRFQNSSGGNSRSNQQQQQQPMRSKKEIVTKEQLDAELDDYLTKMEH